MNIWTFWTFEHLNIWTFEHLNIWTLEHLNIGTLEPWNIEINLTLWWTQSTHWNIWRFEDLTIRRFEHLNLESKLTSWLTQPEGTPALENKFKYIAFLIKKKEEKKMEGGLKRAYFEGQSTLKEHLNILTFAHLNIWTFDHWNIWTYEHLKSGESQFSWVQSTLRLT